MKRKNDDGGCCSILLLTEERSVLKLQLYCEHRVMPPAPRLGGMRDFRSLEAYWTLEKKPLYVMKFKKYSIDRSGFLPFNEVVLVERKKVQILHGPATVRERGRLRNHWIKPGRAVR